MAREAKDRLLFASIRCKYGIDAPLDVAVEELIKLQPRKRPTSLERSSGRTAYSHGRRIHLRSSPPFLDDNLSEVPEPSTRRRSKRIHARPSAAISSNSITSRKRTISISEDAPPRKRIHSWNPDVPEAIPRYQDSTYHNLDGGFSMPPPGQSFPMGYASPSLLSTSSEDPEIDLPEFSFNQSSSIIDSSPPRTPSPASRRLGRFRDVDGKLFDLNATPKLAQPFKTTMPPPSTPPSQCLDLPSSVMTTPGGAAMFSTPSNLFGTPGQTLGSADFAEFLNLTPSPAQPLWGRTPGRTPKTAVKRTPRTIKETRRILNFDTLAPPTGSPSGGGNEADKENGRKGRTDGIPFELGKKLVA
ncbi:MAG: hypothetical protein M1834_008667 [Cirrosporium novae-zelandiae]|nr:MAG: hypothetical protein M1834_008667 [Cirrosporium novae-zelandiae]